MVKQNFYVYILFDWLGIPRYVGKGIGKRWMQHEWKSSTNRMKDEFIEQTWNILEEIPKIKFAENLMERDALALEILLIKIIGRYPNGPLTNMTDGGDGMSGHKHSDQSRAEMSRRALAEGRRPSALAIENAKKVTKGKPRDPDAVRRSADSRRGKKMPPEVGQKISAALTGKKKGSEFKEMRRKIMLGTKRSPESRAKGAESNRGQKRSPEARENLRQGQLRRAPPTQTTKNKISISLTGRIQSLETIEKRTAKLRGKIRSAESRANISAGRLRAKQFRLTRADAIESLFAWGA